MKYWRDESESIIRKIQQAHRVGIVTDFDGTVSPIVSQPDAAQITPPNLDFLERLTSIVTTVAVVSGRTLSDLQSRLPISGLTLIGSHGMERLAGGEIIIAPETAQYRSIFDTILQELQDLPEKFPGVSLENKAITLAVHYRQAIDVDKAGSYLEQILPSLASQHSLKIYKGRKVYEFRPPIDLDKGTILDQIVETNSLDFAFYLGDDVTDADAMNMVRTLREQGICDGFALAVKSEEMPRLITEAADLYLDDVADVETFFGWLLNQFQLRKGM